MSPAIKCCPLEREAKILLAAARCIDETTLLDFTIAKVAREAGVSVGSIYKHFHSKEDVLVALAVRGGEHLHNVFSQILSAPMSVPEQLIAITLIDIKRVDLYPFSRHLEMLVSNDAVLRRTSEFWRGKLTETDQKISTLFQSNLLKAIEAGELICNGVESEYVQQLELGIWAINVGYIQVVLQTHANTGQLTQKLPFPLAEDDPHVLNSQRLINSYQWKRNLDAAGISNAVRQLKKLDFR